MKLSEVIKTTQTLTTSSDKLTAEDLRRAYGGFKNVGPFVLNFKAKKIDIDRFTTRFETVRLNFYGSISVICDKSIPRGYFRACMSDGTHIDIKIFKEYKI